jgi:hypothetical protein
MDDELSLWRLNVLVYLHEEPDSMLFLVSVELFPRPNPTFWQISSALLLLLNPSGNNSTETKNNMLSGLTAMMSPV